MYDQHVLYGQELAEKLPEGIDCVFFTACGSEANAFATQFAQVYTGNYSVLNLRNAYHGHGGSRHLSNIPSWNENIPFTQGVASTVFTDLFRDPQTNKEYGRRLKETLDFATPGKVALFMAEPI